MDISRSPLSLTNVAVASVGVLGLWIVYCGFWRLYLSPLSRFPGPKLAALTLWYESYFDVFKDRGGLFIWELKRMHEKYGPIVRVNPFELHVSDPSFYTEIYAGNARPRDKYAWQLQNSDSTQAMGFTQYHQHHRLRREALNPFFSKGMILRLESTIMANVNRLCDRMRQYEKDGRSISLSAAFLAMATDMATDYAFGRPFSLLDRDDFDPEWNEAITAVLQGSKTLVHFSWLPPLMKRMPGFVTNRFFPELSLLFRIKLRLQAQVEETLARKGSEKSDHSRRTLFEELRDSAVLPPDEKTVSRLTDEAFVVVVAGVETTSKALAIMVYHLLANPPMLEKLRSELQTVDIDQDGNPSLLQLEHLPYLAAVVKEGLRHHSGVTSRSQRLAPTEALQYKGWTIPPGTPISTSSIFVHRNEELFPEPLAFKPERWLSEDAKAKHLDRFLVTFGKGTRGCIGKDLAMAEIHLTLAAVFLQFDLELFETDGSDMTMERDWFVSFPKADSKGVRALVKSVGRS